MMSGETTGVVRLLLRLEGLCVLIAASFFYSKQGMGWGNFAEFFLVPDLSFLAYLGGIRIGAIAYNAAHSYVGAISCLIVGSLLSQPIILGIGMIWCAHIGFDRTLGYGLKYGAGFGYTHLGRIGRFAESAPNIPNK